VDTLAEGAAGTSLRQMSGGQAVAEMLALFDVGPMFGMGGFQLLPYYSAVRDLGLRHYLVDDERSGAFAADAQARITGRPAVCDATLGPGATNLVTALVESLNAGVPVIALIGDAHRGFAGRNMTQEARQIEILGPAAKAIIRIETGERIPELVRRAFTIATSGRPGPVVIALPEDVSHAELELPGSEFWVDSATARVPSRRSRPDAAAVELAAHLLGRARRPVILAGGGVHLSGASMELERLSATHGIPVAHTLSGKGAIACTDELSIGLFGRYSRYANELIESADCLLAVGCKLGEIATKRYSLPLEGTPLIHLDSTAEEIGRWARVAVGLWADAREGLVDLEAALDRPADGRMEYRTEIAGRRADWYAATLPLYQSESTPIHMARLIGELNNTLAPEAIVVADGGFASHWAGLLYDTKQAGRGFVADRGFASIGYGLPGALGAQLAAPDRPVVALTGDGGLNMTIGGLETACRTGSHFTLIVINNAASGYVKALQHAVYGPGAYQSSDLSELNYAEIATSFGAVGIRVDQPGELRDAIRAGAENTSSPTVVDVMVTRAPGEMLPGVDSRTQVHRAGDRIA
jgi:acetolactate synthase-1/2/3 large subunit